MKAFSRTSQLLQEREEMFERQLRQIREERKEFKALLTKLQDKANIADKNNNKGDMQHA